MSEKTIALILKSPMQSWGIDSKFGERGTFEFPTKSAIAGIICAAAGVDKYSASANKALAELSQFKLSSLRVENVGDNKKVRHAPLLTDYHTVDKKYGDGKNMTISRRKYIQDACFIALLTAQEPLCAKIKKLLQNPRWGVWLGRKCCIPSMPLFACIADTQNEAQQQAIDILRKFGDIEVVGECRQIESFGDAEMSVRDDPKDFNLRTFSNRNIITNIAYL